MIYNKIKSMSKAVGGLSNQDSNEQKNIHCLLTLI